jgi:hypothetical protein
MPDIVTLKFKEPKRLELGASDNRQLTSDLTIARRPQTQVGFFRFLEQHAHLHFGSSIGAGLENFHLIHRHELEVIGHTITEFVDGRLSLDRAAFVSTILFSVLGCTRRRSGGASDCRPERHACRGFTRLVADDTTNDGSGNGTKFGSPPFMRAGSGTTREIKGDEKKKAERFHGWMMHSTISDAFGSPKIQERSDNFQWAAFMAA